jgi:tetratricopeptide (TPR) repeat protein
MKPDTYKGIKAAVLYYGGTPQGPYRKDLPVLFVVAEGDVGRSNYANLWSEVLKNNAPWTIQMATALPHAFDAFEDTDESRKVVKETISFWKNHLEPVAQPSWTKSEARAIMSAQYWHDDAKLVSLLEPWIAGHPDDNRALFQYASSLKNLRRYDESEAAYRKVLKLEPNNIQALTYMYLLMHTLERPAEAEPFLLEAEKAGNIDKFTYTGMGYTMYTLNKHKEGIKFFEKVVAVDPSGVNFYNLACGYARIGEKDNAFNTLNKAIDAGYRSRQQFEIDTDLESLRSDARYKALMEKLANPQTSSEGQGSVPPVRAHHALVYDEASKSVIMTAGSTPLNGGQSYKFFNDVWKFDGTKWRLAGNAGDERSGIRLAYDSKQKKIFSYGGYLANGKSAGELRMLDGKEWKVLANLPEMIAAEGGLVFDSNRNKLIAFGGSAERGKMNNATWEWAGDAWKKIEGAGPEGRMGFAMEYDSKRSKTVIYGGSSGGPQGLLDDTWEFDGKKWTKVSVSGPGPRVSPGYAYDSKRGMLIIFGGAGKDGVLGDTWGWDGQDWKKLSETGPSPRVMGQLAYDKDRDRIVMFGGRPGWPNDANDTWEWDGAKWSEIK